MCGLAAAYNWGDNGEFLVTALCRMEYRGYDSHGFLFLDIKTGESLVEKRIGPPSSLGSSGTHGKYQAGLAHTRWASHGAVTHQNTHPISGGSVETGLLSVVHNGIVENYQDLRDSLLFDFEFVTQTDTESLAHLLADGLKDAESIDDVLTVLEDVAEKAEGRYSAVAMYRETGQINGLFLISKGMPLYVCEEYGLVASDPVAFTGFVPSDSIVLVVEDQVGFLGFANEGNPNLWLSPEVLKGCVDVPASTPESEGIRTPGSRMRFEIQEQVGLFRRFDRRSSYWMRGGPLLMFGCGSSYHAGLLATHIFSEFKQDAFACLPSQVPPSIGCSGANWRFLAITQSGETADVLRQVGRVSNCYILTNRESSSIISLYGNDSIQMRCGQELAVAATKSFTATCLRLLELALERAYFNDPDYSSLALTVSQVLSRDIRQLTDLASGFDHIFVAGNGPLYPIALEGALKLKECAYKHAEGICLSEIKHGPLAMMGQNALVIACVLNESDLANLSEVTSRGVPAFALTNAEMSPFINVAKLELPELALDIFSHSGFIQQRTNALNPLSHLFILQRLAYELAMASGIDPDMPRNIAKSLTV